MAHHVPVCTDTTQRRIPKHGLAEKAMLRAWLDFGRNTIRAKVHGLSEENAAKNLVESPTSLGGIVKHLTTVEQHWFQGVLGGEKIAMPFSTENPDGDWVLDDKETLECLLERYDEACRCSDAVIEQLDMDSIGAQTTGDYTLRWALCHVALDTNRHAGQADILREQIDGQRGW